MVDTLSQWLGANCPQEGATVAYRIPTCQAQQLTEEEEVEVVEEEDEEEGAVM